jgi:hypothetical protein
MMAHVRALGRAAALLALGGLAACGEQTVKPGIGRITLTAINYDGTIGPGCTVGLPGPFPTTPTEFAISGVGFSTVPDNDVIVRFTAVVEGELPFHVGTAATQDVVGRVVSDTLICGETPPVLVCGVPSIDVYVEVILPSAVRDDSSPESLGPVFVLTFSAPVITMFDPPCVGSLISVPFTITGMFFGNDGDIATVRFTSNENLPDRDPIFADGTTTHIDVFGTVSGGGTIITGSTPKSTNQVEPLTPNPLHRLSDPSEEAVVDVILANGSCTSGAGSGSVVFDAPEGDTITAPSLAVPTSVPQTIATPFVITGSLAPDCPDPFAPVGGTVQVSFSAPGFPSTPADAFQLDASGAGTQDFDIVDAEIISGTEIRGITPIVRARDDFEPVVRIHFEDGTIVPITTPFIWEAPPVIDLVINQDALSGNGFLQALAPTDFLGCHSSTIDIIGVNFDSPQPAFDPVVQIYDQDTGTSRSLGTGNPAPAPAGNDLGPVFTPTPTLITGETRLEGLLADLDTDHDGQVDAVIRVTAADGQFGEFVVPWFTTQPPFNISNDPDATNNNTDVAIDPTSSSNDFAPATGVGGDAAPGMNICIVAGADVAFQPPPPLFPFAGDEIFVTNSTDGGVNWTNSVIDNAEDGFPADAFRNYAMAGYDASGNLFVSYLVDDLGSLTSNIVLLWSLDHGSTWTDASALLRDHAGHLFGTLDRPALAIGPNGGGANDTVYVSFIDLLGTIEPAGPPVQVAVTGVVAGAFFLSNPLTDAVVVNDGVVGNTFLLQHARCAVGTQGELYVVWSDLDAPFPAPAPPAPPATWTLLMDVDLDGMFGSTFGFVGDETIDVISVPGTPRASSPDFGPPVPMMDLDVMRAGTHAGRCVVAYEDVEPGQGGADVTSVVTRATDNYGASFFDREVVHPVTTADHYLPAITSDPVTGRVYISWMDTTLDASGLLTDRFAAASDDGRNWGDVFRLSTDSSAAPPGDGEFPDYGIQSGIAALGGCVVAAWAESVPSLATPRKDALVRIYQQDASSSP